MYICGRVCLLWHITHNRIIKSGFNKLEGLTMSGILHQVKTETIKQWEIEAMHKVLMYAFNFEHNFIELSGIAPLHHMKAKFSYLYQKYGATGAFMKFYTECDLDNQYKLLTYINNR